jgi:hypothetical protein
MTPPQDGRPSPLGGSPVAGVFGRIRIEALGLLDRRLQTCWLDVAGWLVPFPEHDLPGLVLLCEPHGNLPGLCLQILCAQLRSEGSALYVEMAWDPHTGLTRAIRGLERPHQAAETVQVERYGKIFLQQRSRGRHPGDRYYPTPEALRQALLDTMTDEWRQRLRPTQSNVAYALPYRISDRYLRTLLREYNLDFNALVEEARARIYVPFRALTPYPQMCRERII